MQFAQVRLGQFGVRPEVGARKGTSSAHHKIVEPLLNEGIRQEELVKN